MKKKILAVWLCLIVGSGYAQTITVKDKITLQPIEGLVIHFGGTPPINQAENRIPKKVITDAKGEYTFTTQFNPLEEFTFSIEGYYTEDYIGEQLQKMNFLVLLTEKASFEQKAVVSASRFEEKAEDVAKQISVINKKEMQFKNQATIADLLQQTGKVFIQKSQMGGGSIAMRGFEANKILMVVDGVRMNNAIYRGGHLQNIITMDNAVLEFKYLLLT